MVVGISAAFVMPAGAGAEGDLRVATSLPAPGFWNGDTPSQLDGGFEYELAQKIADELGYTGVKYANVSFDALVAGKAQGFDLALSQVSITPERAKVVKFSVPYYRSDNGIMVNAGTEVPDAAAARKLKWGVQTGTTQVDFLKNKLKVDEKPRVYQETTQMFQALQAKQVDAVMTDTSILLAQASQGGDFEVVGQFKTNTGRYGAIFPDDTDIKKLVNQAIKKLQADGTIDALVEQWLVPEFQGNPANVPYIPL
jgi:polar amino acid transport system substrate-binding protein